MIQSMTGFGRKEVSSGEQKVIAEISSLNSKLPDVRVKTALQLGQFELEIRKLILDNAIRGKIDVTIDIKGQGSIEAGLPNADVIKSYYLNLKSVASELGVDDENLYSTILRLPNVFQPENGELDEELQATIKVALKGALDKLSDFRSTEGKSLYDDLKMRVETIDDLLKQVAPHEKDREEGLKDRLRQKIGELERESIDENRFEQEVIYYLDKLDINEEKTRLAQHCKYFVEVLDADGNAKGKKLNFISQEIGREINTLGAKAQWSPIQRLVVQMKDNLENIKEQLANAL